MGCPASTPSVFTGAFRAKRDKQGTTIFFSRSIFFSGSHNTPYIQLIQYGRRIDEKVYLRTLCLGGELL